MKKTIVGVLSTGLLLPYVALAQSLDASNLDTISVAIGTITNWISVVFVSIAVIFFIWGAFRWVTAGSDDEAKSGAKSHMINALIGIFLIISVWGIINLVLSTVGTDNTVNQAAVNANKAVEIPTL